MSIDLKDYIDEGNIKKIFANNKNKEDYILELAKINKELKNEIKPHIKKRRSGSNKGKEYLINKDNFDNLIVKYWNYKVSQEVIRKLFKNTEKYKSGINAKKSYKKEIDKWNKLFENEEISWPCSQGKFDELVQRINSENISSNEKDKKVKKQALKYRRMKELNTLRNDFIEYIIYTKIDNLIPTLHHSKGVDFYINGVSYDQKVAKSPTKQFKNDYSGNWKNKAKEKPELVAKYLYELQDEGRFGDEPRLLIVYLEDFYDLNIIEKSLNSVSLEKIELSFNFNDNEYQTSCYVILIDKE